ncbi:hypothetical protein PG993_005882 [Apiospora rasikravindrae]|uniref:Uncharacterized protein n=1 Tax=Apiospora rasikravindrae TaxID=990691 RepID=A0ABR1TA23_9PEZI
MAIATEVFPFLLEPVGQHLLRMGRSRRGANVVFATAGFTYRFGSLRTCFAFLRVQLRPDFAVSEPSWLFRQGSDLIFIGPGRSVFLCPTVRNRDSAQRATSDETLGRGRTQALVTLDETTARHRSSLVPVLARRKELLPRVRVGGVEDSRLDGRGDPLALELGRVVVVLLDLEAEVARDDQVGVVARMLVGVEAVDGQVGFELAGAGRDDGVGADPSVAGFEDGQLKGPMEPWMKLNKSSQQMRLLEAPNIEQLARGRITPVTQATGSLSFLHQIEYRPESPTMNQNVLLLVHGHHC